MLGPNATVRRRSEIANLGEQLIVSRKNCDSSPP